MTNRIDHTNCSHEATPAARKRCRVHRNELVRLAQAAYMITQDGADYDAWEDYKARVDNVSFILGISLKDAYDLVERGPVVF